MAGVIEALTRQLVARNLALCSRILIDDSSFGLKEKKNLLLMALDSFQVVYILVDALDEFSSDPDQRHNLAKLFVELRNKVLSTSLRICITSREAEDIFQTISPAEKLSVRASTDEITRYIEQQFGESTHAKYMMEQDSDLLEDVIEAVRIKSDGM